MAISIVAIHRNQNIPPSLALGGLQILSGIIECAFKGDGNAGIQRDTLNFTVGRVNFPGLDLPPVASCTASPASFAYDGSVSNALWAVDGAQVTGRAQSHLRVQSDKRRASRSPTPRGGQMTQQVIDRPMAV